MGKYKMSYCKDFTCLLITLLCNLIYVFGQGNCLLYEINSGERKACELSYQALEHRQGSKESQELFDQAIEVGPNYAYAYYQKSVPFFKRGLFSEGLSLINKAIELEPQNYLFYRAYYYFYNRSYDLCIRDLEELYGTYKATYITTPGGELEMRLLLALSYAHTGKIEKGIDWIHNLMDSYKNQPLLKGVFDHYCLGVLYFKSNKYDLAKTEFEKQILIDGDFADAYYYIGLLHENESKIKLAKENYKKCLDKMNRKNGGYSTSFFTEYTLDVETVEMKLIK